MTYSELIDICEKKQMLIKDVAAYVGMSYDGLRNGMNEQRLGMLKVLRLCECLGITPNQFYGVETPTTINANQYGLANSQNIGAVGIELLQQQLVVKDEQIKHLLELLKKQ